MTLVPPLIHDVEQRRLDLAAQHIGEGCHDLPGNRWDGADGRDHLHDRDALAIVLADVMPANGIFHDFDLAEIVAVNFWRRASIDDRRRGSGVHEPSLACRQHSTKNTVPLTLIPATLTQIIHAIGCHYCCVQWNRSNSTAQSGSIANVILAAGHITTSKSASASLA